MSFSHTTILIILQFGLCLIISVLALYRFETRDFKVKIIGILFLVKCSGILLLMIPHSFYPNLYVIAHKIGLLPYEYIFITILYATAFGKEYHKLFALYLFIIIPFSLVSVFSDLYFFKDSFLDIVCSTQLTFYSLLYFYSLFDEIPKRPLENHFMFWISTGVLIYNIGITFLMIMGSLLAETSQTKGVFDLLHHALSITSYTLILIGLLVAGRKV